jgi:hypothetical protein
MLDDLQKQQLMRAYYNESDYCRENILRFADINNRMQRHRICQALLSNIKMFKIRYRIGDTAIFELLDLR